MGMFAYVEFEAACPLCGLVLREWQTKDPEDLDLQRVQVEEVQNWYTNCYGIVFEDEDGEPGQRDARWIRAGDRRFRQVGCGAWLEYQDGVLTVTRSRKD